MAVKSNSCPSWRFQQLRLVGQLGFLDSRNVDMLLSRKVSSSVILPLIPFDVHCISRRKLVGIGVESGPGLILILPAH